VDCAKKPQEIEGLPFHTSVPQEHEAPRAEKIR